MPVTTGGNGEIALQLSAAIATSAACIPVIAVEGDWYISGNISHVDIDDADLDSNEDTTGNREVDAEFDSDTGYGLGVTKQEKDYESDAFLAGVRFKF